MSETNIKEKGGRRAGGVFLGVTTQAPSDVPRDNPTKIMIHFQLVGIWSSYFGESATLGQDRATWGLGFLSWPLLPRGDWSLHETS